MRGSACSGTAAVLTAEHNSLKPHRFPWNRTPLGGVGSVLVRQLRTRSQGALGWGMLGKICEYCHLNDAGMSGIHDQASHLRPLRGPSQGGTTAGWAGIILMAPLLPRSERCQPNRATCRSIPENISGKHTSIIVAIRKATSVGPSRFLAPVGHVRRRRRSANPLAAHLRSSQVVAPVITP